jgi:hypothetical protein
MLNSLISSCILHTDSCTLVSKRSDTSRAVTRLGNVGHRPLIIFSFFEKKTLRTKYDGCHSKLWAWGHQVPHLSKTQITLHYLKRFIFAHKRFTKLCKPQRQTAWSNSKEARSTLIGLKLQNVSILTPARLTAIRSHAWIKKTIHHIHGYIWSTEHIATPSPNLIRTKKLAVWFRHKMELQSALFTMEFWVRRNVKFV